MGRMTKTRKAYRMYQRTKYEDTRPEIQFDKIFGNRVFKPLPFPVIDHDSRKIYTLRVDRGFGGTNVLVEIDGPYHDTALQQKKTAWRDKLINATGNRIIHIDYLLLMNKEHHDYVRQQCELFLRSQANICMLHG